MMLAGVEAGSARRGGWHRALLLVAGALIAMSETRAPSIVGAVEPAMDAMRLAAGLLVLGVALDGARTLPPLPWRQEGVAIGLAFFGCLVAGWLGGVSWPNSGDEYSYIVLADMFRAGQLVGPPPPDPALFGAYHVLVRNGVTFSPYPPAWSALLAPFRAIGAVWLVNPLLTVLLGCALLGAFRRLGVAPAMRKPALALVLLTPFTLFLGGSVFPQTMAAALVGGIIWAQLGDETRPGIGNKLLIGAMFGVLLLTRYDVAAVAVLAYAIDRLAKRRLRAVGDGIVVVLGMLPFVVALGLYDAAITGNPLQLTSTWASPDALALPGAALLAARAALLDLYWLGDLAQFGGLPVLVLSVAGLVLKVRRRTCRFFDLLLPLAVMFYSFVPFTGGHQYGPRYWFWAWPFASLTIVTALIDEAGTLHLFGRRVAFERLATACLLTATAAFFVLLASTHSYIAARRAVFTGPHPAAPAIILVPSRSLRIWPWQAHGIAAGSRDFTRNLAGYQARTLFGRADLPDAVARACRLNGRLVLRWLAPGHLLPVACP